MYYIWEKIDLCKKLCEDNNVCVEFLPNGFCIKDLATRTIILIGDIKDGLYRVSLVGGSTIEGEI